MEQSNQRYVHRLAEATFVLFSVVTFLAAEFNAGMTCDDVCSTDPGDSWRSYAGSPQWDQIAFLGWAVLLLGAACAIAVRRGHRGVARVGLGGWALCCFGLASLLGAGEAMWMLLAAGAGITLVLTGGSRDPA